MVLAEEYPTTFANNPTATNAHVLVQEFGPRGDGAPRASAFCKGRSLPVRSSKTDIASKAPHLSRFRLGV